MAGPVYAGSLRVPGSLGPCRHSVTCLPGPWVPVDTLSPDPLVLQILGSVGSWDSPDFLFHWEKPLPKFQGLPDPVGDDLSESEDCLGPVDDDFDL